MIYDSYELSDLQIKEDHQTERARIDAEAIKYKARLAARDSTKEALSVAAVGLVIAAVILGIVFAIGHYRSVGGERDQQYRVKCIENSGSWVPIKNGRSSTMACLQNGLTPKDVAIKYGD